MILGVIITGLVGVLLVVLGYLIWKKEKITLLHDYHYDKVSPEDKKAFCALSGIGALSIGVSLLITAVIFAITSSALSYIAFGLGLILGMALFICADVKYN